MERNTRILIVDDNKSIHEDFRKVLCSKKNDLYNEVNELENELFGEDEISGTSAKVRMEYQVDSAYQGQEALAMIQTAEDEGRPYALAFMDVRMPPGWDGVETISRIWLKFPYIEMVLCTAYSDYTWNEIIDKLGATDKLLFLRKPFDAIAVQQMALTLVKKWNLSEHARSYVKKLEVEVNDRTTQLKTLLKELEVKNEKLLNINEDLKHIALHDTLTKLPNRALFNDRLQHSVEIAQRENHKFAIFNIDIDKFKEINDTHGHLTGDAVLYEIGERLSLVLRTSDTIARLGGDEFALILPNIDDGASELLADKIIRSLDSPVVFANQNIDVNISIGIAIYPEHGDSNEVLLKHADSAMYNAKRNGLGYAVFDSVEDSKRQDRAQLISDFKHAVNANALHLNYQPIVDLNSHRIIGVEALARWHHPDRGMISPDQFIPLAEKKGLIQQLTLWVFDVAFKQCAEWHEMGAKITMSVNLSPRNFLDPRLLNEISDALNKWKLKPEWIRLEITENMTMSQPGKAFEIITKLENLGIEISIDDFGTGYSSLSYLKKLPVKELKIDKSFIIDLDKDHDNKVIVNSTINLAHDLGLDVVAEGVENKNILTILQELGCNRAQGYHMCKPKSAKEMSRWIFESEWRVEQKNKAQGSTN
ncbi:MAG: EAL domain-containing protein [Gammaproteobacteria bacterium]|nr:EAL domain-containing protein [Gammaproteobacteria bacterium]